MKKSNIIVALGSACALFVGTTLFANEKLNPAYQCMLKTDANTLKRRIEVVFAGPNNTMPCKVNYYKDTEAPNNGPEVLWTASNAQDYCANKADAFAVKLRGMGWDCQDQQEEAATPVKTEEAATPVNTKASTTE